MNDDTPSPSISDPCTVVAIAGNSSWEVGFAMIQLNNPKLTLAQFSDNRQFESTVAYLNSRDVRNIAYIDSHRNTPLVRLIQQRFTGLCMPMQRKTFNEDHGDKVIHKLACNSLNERDVAQKYLARAAANALFLFLESQLQLSYQENSMLISVEYNLKRMYMDANTIRNLELLLNKRTGKACGSLFSVVDHTQTLMGARFLRSQLLSPLADVQELEERHEAVSELLSKPGVMRILAPVLSSFHDIDSLCFEFAKQKRNRDTISVLKREIDSFIKLREVLQLLPQLSEVLVTLQGEFWKRLHDIISRDDSRSHVQAMLIAVEDKLSPDCKFERSAEKSQLQEIFCIRSDQTGQLDIARLAYVNCVKEMEELVATYNQDLQISVKLHFTTSRGYHLKVPRKHASRLPSSFVQVLSSKGTIACTTAEIASLNRSQHEQVEEIFRLTVKQLCHLESLLVHHIGFLFQLSEVVAMADFCLSNASFASLSKEEFNTKFARPEFTKDDEAPEFALHGGRHPLIEELLKGECVANDCIFEPHGPRLAVVMGSNCCGKTTYLKQVALSVVMAQVGIQPPAETFKLPIFHRILTRLGTEDNLQGNASTFSFEMSEMAYILQVLEMNQGNTASLVLADELGRGTSTRDGLSLSWAVAEHIVKFPRTFSLFTTHFGAFRLFPRSEHLAILLEFSSSSIEDSDVDSIPAHKVKKVSSTTNAPEYSADCSVLVYGSSENSYGLRLAEHCGIPHGVIDIATRMRIRLVESIQTSCTVQLSLGKKLQQVAAQGLSNDQLRNVLGEIQKNKTSTT